MCLNSTCKLLWEWVTGKKAVGRSETEEPEEEDNYIYRSENTCSLFTTQTQSNINTGVLCFKILTFLKNRSLIFKCTACSTAGLQQGSSWFKTKDYIRRCIFSPCMYGFPLGTPAFSHYPETAGWLIDYSKLPICMRVCSCFSFVCCLVIDWWPIEGASLPPQ